MKNRLRIVSLVAAGLLISPLAFSGGFEKTTNFGARAAAMGGAATAYNNNVSAVFYNPALMAFVKDWTIGLDVLPSFAKQTVTIGGTDTDSSTAFLPIFNVAGAGRVSDDIVVGIGVYTPGGLKTSYGATTVGEVDFKIFEAAPFVVFEVGEGFAIALQYRAIYATFSQTVPSVGLTHADFKGTNFLGGRLGVSHKVNDNWYWGASIRSLIKASLTGKTSLTGAGIASADSTLRDVSYPWSFQWGGAYVADENAWSVALDLQYILYSMVDKLDFDVVDTVLPTNEATLDVTTNWKSTFKTMLGAEVKLADNWFARLGGGVHTKVTNELNDSIFFTPPSLGISAGAGFGYQADDWSADLSYDLNTGSTTGTTGVGNHKATAHAIGLSLNYNAI